MHKLTIPFLIAASDMLDKIEDVITKLAHQIGVPVQELFYFWMSPRRSEMEGVGIIKDTNWKYWFHGLNCELEHMKDKRYLWVDFGPKGRIDIIGGVLGYVMTSKPPWPEYKELKEFFVGQDSRLKFEQSSPCDHPLHLNHPIILPSQPDLPSSSYSKLRVLYGELISHKFIEPADSELCKLSEKSHTVFRFIARFKFNRLFKTMTRNGRLDTLVCCNHVITVKGKDQIRKWRGNC